MLTKRINEIVNAGARTRLNDIEFLQKEVDKFLCSRERQMQIEGNNYYEYRQDILNKKRMVIGADGNLKQDDKLPNNKYTDNVYADMVDQKVNYILSKPITFSSDDENYEEALKDIFNKKFHRLIKNVGKDSYNGKMAYIYVYYDENGELQFMRFRPWEVKVYWKDDDHTQIDWFFRYYEQQGYEGSIEKTYRFVDVYDTDGIHKFEYAEQGLRPDYQTYYFEMPDLEGEVIPYNWDKIPLIPLKSNSNEIPLICKCKCLQDGVNDMLSMFADVMKENSSGTSILVLKNYDGTNLGEFRNNLAQYRTVKVRTVDGADGGIDKLEIEVNAENFNVILKELRKAIVRNCKGYDVDELKSSGSPNEMTIKAVYSAIDLDANELETEYQASFEDLLWFVNYHLKVTGKGDFTNTNVDVIFNRDMMVNEAEVIDCVQKSVGILSDETLIAQHPWTDNVQKELDRLAKQKEENMQNFLEGMNQGTNAPDGEGDE